jgi:hypothetical protein
MKLSAPVPQNHKRSLLKSDAAKGTAVWVRKGHCH